MESIIKMYQIAQLTSQHPRCALMWLPFFLTETLDIDERINWLHHVKSDELDSLKDIYVPEKEIKSISEACSLLEKFYRKLKYLIMHNEDIAQYIQSAPKDDQRFDYEVRAYLKSFTPADIVALAQSYHALEHVNYNPALEAILRIPQYYNGICFKDIYDFSRSLYIAECIRQHFIKGNPTAINIYTIHTFPVKLRNACFDEYIRLRVQQIRNDENQDNDRLYEMSELDCLRELYEHDTSVHNRLAAQKKLQVYKGILDGRCKVPYDMIKTSEYFVQYLADRIKALSNTDTAPTQIVHNYYDNSQHLDNSKNITLK